MRYAARPTSRRHLCRAMHDARLTALRSSLRQAALAVIAVGLLAAGCNKPTAGPGSAPAAGNGTANSPVPKMPPQRTIQFERRMQPQRLAAPQATAEQALAAIDAAFSQAPAPLGPNIVVFPAVDETNRIREDGTAISEIGVMRAVYGPQRRLKIQVRGLRNLFREADCSETGTLVDEERIQRCVTAMGTSLYVVPRIEEIGREYELTMAFHGNGDRPDKEYVHRVSIDELTSVPCLMAEDIVDFAGIKLTDQERALLMERPVRNSGELLRLQEFMSDRRTMGTFGRNALLSLKDTPDLAPLWDAYLSDAGAGAESLSYYDSLQPPIPCDRLKIAYAKQLRDLGRPDQAVMMLLDLVPTHRDDASFYGTLVWSAALWGKPDVTERLLQAWSDSDKSYRGHLMRGDVYVDWAWHARGSGFADTVTEEGWMLFGERLEQARDELNAAIAVNLDGWEAHAKMLVVAKGMGFPRSEADRHLNEAARAYPGNVNAYINMSQYLLRRWHGTSEELLAFADRCLSTGRWEEGIPHLVIDCVLDVCRDTGTSSIARAEATRPEIVTLVKRYYEEAVRAGSPKDASKAATFYAVLISRSGNYADIEPLVPHFFERDLALMPYEFESYFLSGAAVDSRLPEDAASQFRVQLALYRGDLDAAEALLERVEAAPLEDFTSERYVPRLRRALELARKLEAEKSITITADEMFASFDYNYREVRWRVEAERMICEPGGISGHLILPFGLSRAIISGTLEWDGDAETVDVVSHACSARDMVAIRYYVWQGRTQIVRNGMATADLPNTPPGPKEFRLEWGGEYDTLQPFAGVEEVAPVIDDAPGTLAIQIEGLGPRESQLRVGPIRIELK